MIPKIDRGAICITALILVAAPTAVCATDIITGVPDADRILASTSTSAHYADESPWETDLAMWSDETKLPVVILIDGYHLEKPGAHLDEASLLHDRRTPPQYHRHDISSRSMFDLICSENLGYEWRLVNGVINILPRDLKSDHLQPLNNVVTQFGMRERSYMSVLSGLFRHEHIPLETGGVVTGSLSHYISSAPIEYACENITVLECINVLAKRADRSWQIIYRNDIGSFYVMGSGKPFFTPTKNRVND